MNYAEDRLDRRARTSASRSAANDTTVSVEAGASAVSSQLEHDLLKAHSAIWQHHKSCTPLQANENREDALIELLAAHQLAGKTLRDGGFNRHAVFHFGVAWKLCSLLNSIARNRDENELAEQKVVQEWEAVGDYAQMAEFAGFPEVGVTALLFYRAGSFGCCSDDECVLDEIHDGISNDQECGCGVASCGSSPCYIAFPTSSSLLNDVLDAFDELRRASSQEMKRHPSALDILNQLALLSGKSARNSSDDRLIKMQQYMSDKTCFKVPAVLQFWDIDNINKQNSSHPNTAVRRMPSVLLLLLLKLLYASPIAGPFLVLACHSVPCISALLPTASCEGRHLAKHYKSHWAYYVFIRALVLGERVKNKTAGKGTVANMPVWDVLFTNDESKSEQTMLDPSRDSCSNSFSVYIQDLFIQLKFGTKKLPPVKTFDLPHRQIYVLGDSHVLSVAWQSINLSTTGCKEYRTLVPFPATGIKAWHFRKSTKFFTRYNLQAILERLRNNSTHCGVHTIVISAGEIDCREGIGGSLLHGYYRDCNHAIENTALKFLESLMTIANCYKLQILLMPVAPHAYRSEKNGKALGRAKRRETMHLWNETLRRELCTKNKSYDHVFLLDYEKNLRVDDQQSPVGYVLKPSFNADYTHVNGAVVHLLKKSLDDCGCDILLL
jgi:hypothetical protein